MRLNVGKTEYLECGVQENGTIDIDGVPLKKCTSFQYLGSTITPEGDTRAAADSRINAAWMKWREVTGVLCDRRMPDKLKSKLYRTVVRPVALYSTECWPTTARHEQALNVMEMKMLRWSIGVTRLDRVRNDDVRARMRVAPISDKLKEGRLRWFGHVVRREKETVAGRVYSIKVDGKRPRGRPKTRWMDSVRKDKKDCAITEADAQDRILWRRKTRYADPAEARE